MLFLSQVGRHGWDVFRAKKGGMSLEGAWGRVLGHVANGICKAFANDGGERGVKCIYGVKVVHMFCVPCRAIETAMWIAVWHDCATICKSAAAGRRETAEVFCITNCTMLGVPLVSSSSV